MNTEIALVNIWKGRGLNQNRSPGNDKNKLNKLIFQTMGLKGNPLGSDILSLFSEEQNIVAFFIQIFLKINFFFFQELDHNNIFMNL